RGAATSCLAQGRRILSRGRREETDLVRWRDRRRLGRGGLAGRALEDGVVSRSKLMRRRVDVDHLGGLGGLAGCAAVRVGDWVFVSGQVSADASGAVCDGGDPRAQAHRAFAGLQATLEATGASLADVVDVMTFHLDMRDVDVVFDVGREYLPGG